MVQINKSEQFYIELFLSCFWFVWKYIPVDFKQGIIFVCAAQAVSRGIALF